MKDKDSMTPSDEAPEKLKTAQKTPHKHDHSDHDDLWARVARTVIPIDRHDVLIKPDSRPEQIKFAQDNADDHGGKAPSGKVTYTAIPHKTGIAPPPLYSSTSHRPAQDMDRRTRDKLRQGKMPIEGRLDLHGFNQEQAHSALIHFINTSYAAGKRCILIITGKGGCKAGSHHPAIPERKGILREKVPQWLHDPAIVHYILHSCSARPCHGGEGALYIYLRRHRD